MCTVLYYITGQCIVNMRVLQIFWITVTEEELLTCIDMIVLQFMVLPFVKGLWSSLQFRCHWLYATVTWRFCPQPWHPLIFTHLAIMTSHKMSWLQYLQTCFPCSAKILGYDQPSNSLPHLHPGPHQRFASHQSSVLLRPATGRASPSRVEWHTV